MVTDAAGTGKPVYVQALKGGSPARPWRYAPINDTELVASSVRHALHLETKA
jgi:mitochondrial fission protein ELM1